MFKKLLVKQLEEPDEQKENNVVEKENEENEVNTSKWKDVFVINPNLNEYGNQKAEIIDFAVRDEEGNLTATIEKGSMFEIVSKVRFNETIQNPIFTYSFCNVQGTIITGTNTMYEKADVGEVRKGEIYECHFEQAMSLQGGNYLLSISCTGYKDGEFQVYHRLYDVINITVISEQNTVGFYDMDSEVTVERIR